MHECQESEKAQAKVQPMIGDVDYLGKWAVVGKLRGSGNVPFLLDIEFCPYCGKELKNETS